MKRPRERANVQNERTQAGLSQILKSCVFLAGCLYNIYEIVNYYYGFCFVKAQLRMEKKTRETHARVYFENMTIYL
jgi:hypothetical protein